MRGVVVAIAMATLLGCGGKTGPAPSGAHAPPHAMTPAEIAATGLPSVVTISSAHVLGTGFVVRADGWIATNLHVISAEPHMKVTLRDGRKLDVVEVLSASPDHDLALVRVEAKGLPVLPLGDSSALRPGDPIVAIGNPMGLEDTISNGLVSAFRKVSDTFEVLQVSAPIAPGSSGGPLFNDHGEVVAIATLVSRMDQNLAFGVPVRYLAPLIAQPEPIPFDQFAALMAQARQEKLRKSREAGERRMRPTAPRFPVSFLVGCNLDAQKLVVKMLGEAIEIGSPLFNARKPDACYHEYDGAAADLERKLPTSCTGPIKALADAQKHAAGLPDPVAQAWAMRDVFDGLLDVIARKQEGSSD
jgi:hypothetical protein